MTDRPCADELLGIARDTVLQQLLPHLPPSAHYAARMVANAIAIARREHDAMPLPATLVHELTQLAGDGADAHSWPERLTQRIRAGALDADPALAGRMARALREWTALRVAISNPRLLEQPPA